MATAASMDTREDNEPSLTSIENPHTKGPFGGPRTEERAASSGREQRTARTRELDEVVSGG